MSDARRALDDRLIAAHADGDAATLARLYAEASHSTDAPDAAGFYLTHAYIFALEAGLDEANEYKADLIGMGRETEN